MVTTMNIKSSRNFTLVLLIAFCAPIVVAQGWRTYQRKRHDVAMQVAASRVAPLPAYTAVAIDRHGDGSGVSPQAPPAVRVIRAVRNDQSTVEQWEVQLSNPPFVTRDIEMSDGISMKVIDRLKVVSTTQLPRESLTDRPLRRLDPASNCTVLISSGQALFRFAGHARLLNVDVVEVHDDAGQYWLAPSYGCLEMKKIVYRTDAQGVRRASSLREVISLTPGEPDAALFRIPIDYDEVPPSEMGRRECAWKGCGARSAEDQQARRQIEARLDDRYQRLRPSEEYFARRRAGGI